MISKLYVSIPNDENELKIDIVIDEDNGTKTDEIMDTNCQQIMLWELFFV